MLMSAKGRLRHFPSPPEAMFSHSAWFKKGQSGQVLDDFLRYIIACKLYTTMRAWDGGEQPIL